MSTAQVLFHRFYFKKSFKRYNVKQVAMAALFLAAKVEEVPKRARDVLNVFHHIEQVKTEKKMEPLNFSKRKYWDMKKDLIKTERFMLKEMGFSTHVEHPHKFLLSYLDLLSHSNDVSLAQMAWNYMNDSLREPLCVRFRPEVIACGCIYMASHVMKIPLPEQPHPWWELFDAKLEQLDEIAHTINLLYKESEAKYITLHNSKKPDEIKSRKKSHSSSRSSRSSRSRSRSGSRSPSSSPSPSTPSSESKVVGEVEGAVTMGSPGAERAPSPKRSKSSSKSTKPKEEKSDDNNNNDSNNFCF